MLPVILAVWLTCGIKEVHSCFHFSRFLDNVMHQLTAVRQIEKMHTTTMVHCSRTMDIIR